MTQLEIAKNLLSEKTCDTCRVEQDKEYCKKFLFSDNDINFYKKLEEKTCKYWLDFFE